MGNRPRYSLRLFFVVRTAVAMVLALLAWRIREVERKERTIRAQLLIDHAAMILSTPHFSEDESSLELLSMSPAKAIDLCTQAIDLDPELRKAYLLRATAFEQLGNRERATRDRETAATFQ